MNYDEIRQYVQQHGVYAEESHLLEAIEEHTTDPVTRELITFWFDQYDRKQAS